MEVSMGKSSVNVYCFPLPRNMVSRNAQPVRLSPQPPTLRPSGPVNKEPALALFHMGLVPLSHKFWRNRLKISMKHHETPMNLHITLNFIHIYSQTHWKMLNHLSLCLFVCLSICWLIWKRSNMIWFDHVPQRLQSSQFRIRKPRANQQGLSENRAPQNPRLNHHVSY